MNILNCRGRLLDLSTPVVMGVLNSTTDSFYSGSRVTEVREAVNRGLQMLALGASIIDIGGMSTRPGAVELSVQQEMDQVIPIITELRANAPEAFISVDTYRTEVARAALYSGANIINDISGGTLDPELPLLAGEYRAPYILMHMRGTPATMQSMTVYEDLIDEILDFFYRKIYEFRAMGLVDIIIDPGFGFAKTIDQNYQLLDKFEIFSTIGAPVLAGLSRKSMFWKRLGETPETVLPATNAANAIALLKGAQIIRVHDIAPAVQVRNMIIQMKKAAG